MNRLPTWRYRLCLRLASPLILLHLLWRTLRDGGWPYFKQRLGFINTDKQARIHIHAASVGEVITVLPLVVKLQQMENPPAFLITTNTPTGASILKKRMQGNVVHGYLPIDFSGATKRFFAKLNITSVWLVETEIWPWLFSRAQNLDMPVLIINARLGHKSDGRLARFFNDTYRQALHNVVVLARSDADARRFVQRGVHPDKVSVLGNLKFAPTEQSPQTRALLNQAYVLAASTHDNEELSLARAWLEASVDGLLVIAPRHAERGSRLIRQLTSLQQEIAPELPAPARRSIGQGPTKNCRLYLADTLGELPDWYAHARASFVGGSLIQRGGHNVLEPARLAIPIIVGKHTYNFAAEVDLLKSVDGIAISDTAEHVVELLVEAVSNELWNSEMGNRANSAVRTYNNVLEKYSTSLAGLTH